MQVVGKYGLRPADQGKQYEEVINPQSLESVESKHGRTSKETTSIRFPIRFKIILPYLILALIIALVGAYILTRVVLDTVEERFTNQLVETGKLASESIVQEENKLLETLRLITHTNGTLTAVMNEDAETLRDISYPLLLNASVEALEIIDPSGRSLLSLRHRAGGRIEEYDFTRGDNSYQDWEFVNKVLNGEVDDIGDKYSGIAQAAWGEYLYVAGPIFDQNRELVGAILVGSSLNEVVQGIREATLSQVTIYDLEGKEINTSFIESSPIIRQETKSEILSRQENESLMRDLTTSGINYKEILAPLEVRSGSDVGFLGTALPQTFLIRASNSTKLQLFSFATISFLFLIAAGIFIANRLTRPLLNVVDASSKVAAGEHCPPH